MIIVRENAVLNALKRINEVRDPWREAEDAYLMREKLPKGMVKIGDDLYQDDDGNEYNKDEYGHFVPVSEEPMGMEGDITENNIPDDVQTDFTSLVISQANKQQQFGQNSVLGLMYDYYFNDNDQALYEIVEQYKNEMGIQTEEDSNEDIYLYNQIRLAVEAWGKYANDSEEEPETEPMEEQGQLCEAYGIGHNGSFLSNKAGWGPTFTMFPQDAKTFATPDEAQAYIQQNLPDFGASVVSVPTGDDDELYEMRQLKESIKSLIRESLFNAGMLGQPAVQQRPVDTQERGHGTWKSKHNNQNLHFKQSPNTNRERRQSKRATVIRWLRDPSVNCAEIMRLLWDPAPEDEDTKRGEFYKKRDGAINKDSGARYSFSDEEINSLYKIKSGRA